MNKSLLIAGLALVCLLELVIIGIRYLPAPAPASPPAPELPPVTVAVRRERQLAATLPDPMLPPEPATPSPVARAEAEPLPVATNGAASAQAELPAALAKQIQAARAAGGDAWLLAHVAATQFEREWQAWQRSRPQETASVDREALRRDAVSAAAGADALRQLEFREWSRNQPELRDPSMTPTQALALYDLQQWYNGQLAELRKTMASDPSAYRQAWNALAQERMQRRQKILGR